MSKRLIPIISGAAALLLLFIYVIFQRIIYTDRVYAKELTKGLKSHEIRQVKLEPEFISVASNFSIDLFKRICKNGSNVIISPASIYMALGMTENGASEETLKEFEGLLGGGKISADKLNEYYYSFYESLNTAGKGSVNIGNSIWYSQAKNFTVKKEFLQAAADYYAAKAYKADFSSIYTISDINNWVKKSTGGEINKIVDKIDKNNVMYIIDTVYFNERWDQQYKNENVVKDKFTTSDGAETDAVFMKSYEYKYLENDKVRGFIKPYKGGKYSFVGILPNAGVSLDQYIASLTGEDFVKLINYNKAEKAVEVLLPKFKSEGDLQLVEPLKEMGLKLCFDSNKADFSKMGQSSSGNLFISSVLHKTFISVDTEGTKAAAATKVEMKSGAAPVKNILKLNRPFIYAIIDNTTELPIFIGTMMNPN